MLIAVLKLSFHNFTSMNIKLCIFILLFFQVLSLNLSAQEWQWAKGSACTDERPTVFESSPIAVDNKGNVYEIGLATAIYDDTLKSSFGPFTLIDSYNTGSQSIIVSTDSNGSYRWVMGSQKNVVYFTNMSVDLNGTTYIIGYCPAGLFTFGSISFYSSDYFCIKVNASGNVLWIKDIAPGAYWISTISVNSSGSFYIAGMFTNTITIDTTILTNNDPTGVNTDIFYAKYDSSGHAYWAKSFGGRLSDYLLNDDISNAVITKDSNLYIAGYFRSDTMIIGSDTLNGSASLPFYIAKFNDSGHPLWARSINSLSAYAMYDRINGLATDNNGNAYISGSYGTNFHFGVDTLPFADSLSLMYLAKYDSSGNAKWAKTIGPSKFAVGYSIATDGCGNIWMIGGRGFNSDSMFLAQWDTAGYVKDTFWLSVGGDDQAGICVDSKGCFYVGGDYNNPFILGGDTLILVDSNLEALFVLKYRYDYPGCIPDHSENSQNLNYIAHPLISLFPNPTTESFTINSDCPFQNGSQVEIYDLTGRLINKYPLSGNNTSIPVNNLQPGMYECRIYNPGHGIETRKLAVMR